MTDTNLTPTETPKPKRKYVRRKRVRAAPVAAAAVKVPKEFEGLTPTECCDACHDKGICIISGGICAHPMKGGLQSAYQGNSEIVKRYRRAKNAMADAKLDLQKMAGG